MKRILSIDIVRGIVMVIMALDHTRDLIHSKALTQDPTNLATTSPALFFTRWITHFCAPTFVFLAGVSVWLAARKKPMAAQRRFLVTRGLWLVLLEFTVITFGIWWDIHFSVFLLQVIAAIGFGFIVLGLVLPLPARSLGIAGLLIIALHGILPATFPSQSPAMEVAGSLLLTGGFVPLSPSIALIVGYPLLPWLGVILAGYGAGFIFLREPVHRKNHFLRLSILCIGLFVLLRSLNMYGDPAPWSVQKSTTMTLISFLNVSKYPPSFLFCLATLGGMFFLLWMAEGIQGRLGSILETYGKVPMFYYLVHWYMIHLSMFLLLFAQGFRADDFRFGFSFGRPEKENGLGLAGVYPIWMIIVILLYPLCRWYARYKASHPEKYWLKYL